MCWVRDLDGNKRLLHQIKACDNIREVLLQLNSFFYSFFNLGYTHGSEVKAARNVINDYIDRSKPANITTILSNSDLRLMRLSYFHSHKSKTFELNAVKE